MVRAVVRWHDGDFQARVKPPYSSMMLGRNVCFISLTRLEISSGSIQVDLETMALHT